MSKKNSRASTYRQVPGRFASPYPLMHSSASLLDHLWDTEYCNTCSAISDLGWFVVMGHWFLGIPVFLGLFDDIALVL